VVAGAAALPTVLAAGCAAGGGPAAPARSLEPQLLKIWVPFGDQQFNFEASWADFLAEHAGWTREIVYDVSNVKFVTSVTAGESPDVFMQPSLFLLDAAAKGMIRPLDQYISRDRVDWKQYYAAGKIGALYRTRHYGLPHHVDVYSVYGNEKVLREGAFDPKKKPASWDELLATNTRLTRQGPDGQPTRLGFIPFYGVSPFVLYYFVANGAPLLSADGARVGFDTAAGLEVLEWMSNAIKSLGGWERIQAFRGQFANGENGVGWALGRDAIGYGYVGCWNLGFRVFKENPNAEIAQWPLPGGPSARGKEFGQYIAMHTVLPAESRSADAGWEFVRHDTSAAGQKHIQWNFGSFDISSIPAVANNPESLKLQPWRKRMHELMAEAKEPSYFPHPGSGEIGAAITTAITPFLKGEEGPKATMDVLKRDVERLMAQFRVP
jgi:multiple sugar transport system substrate-binding protein